MVEILSAFAARRVSATDPRPAPTTQSSVKSMISRRRIDKVFLQFGMGKKIFVGGKISARDCSQARNRRSWSMDGKTTRKKEQRIVVCFSP
jgi:hypothetical protein